MKRISALLLLVCLTSVVTAQRISIQTGKRASAREQYAAEVDRDGLYRQPQESRLQVFVNTLASVKED